MSEGDSGDDWFEQAVGDDAGSDDDSDEAPSPDSEEDSPDTEAGHDDAPDDVDPSAEWERAWEDDIPDAESTGSNDEGEDAERDTAPTAGFDDFKAFDEEDGTTQEQAPDVDEVDADDSDLKDWPDPSDSGKPAPSDADEESVDDRDPTLDPETPGSEDDGDSTPDPEAPPSEDDGGGSLFEDDFASALSDSDGPDPGGGGGTVGGEFGMTGGSGGGMDPNDSALDMGTDDFGGFGDLGGGDDSFDADEEELDSEIDRINLGVEGLDAMIQGGIPERTLMVAIGSPGTGKTTLGLQFLHEGLANGEKAVYITLEETRQRVIRSATEKNIPFDDHYDDGNLAVVDIDPVEMANSLQTIRSELPRLIDEFGASRLVLDSVSLLEMMYQDRATRRNEIYDFTKSLKASGVTTMMTSEADDDNPYASRHGIVEYLTDAVFILQYVRPSDFRETRMAIEIQKIRDAHHSRETKPYEITNEGLNVYRQANIF